VTNGTFPLKRYDGLYFYWVSIDGTEKIHDSIRGKGAYSKTRMNVLDYIARPSHNGKPAWKDIWLSMTINSINWDSIDDVVEEWKDEVNKIGFQFHTPFVKRDPLMLPFGKKRDEVVDKLIALHKKYPKFVINNEKQLLLMKGNWGGVGTTPVQCPSWAILSMDHMGRIKQPCCIGSAGGNSAKPICGVRSWLLLYSCYSWNKRSVKMCISVRVDLAVVCSLLIEMEGLAINHLCMQYLIEYRLFTTLRWNALQPLETRYVHCWQCILATVMGCCVTPINNVDFVIAA
jgi:hypothetical protein